MTTQKEWKERRANLVKALRSGDYKQGQDKLRSVGDNGKDKFCCLGVACDLVNPNRWSLSDEDDLSFEIYDDDSSTSMSLNVREFYGFVTEDGGFRWNTVPNDLIARLKEESIHMNVGNIDGTLSILNDKGVSFNLIADVIESSANLFYNK